MNSLLSGKSFEPERRKNVRYSVQGGLDGYVIHGDGRKTNVTFGDISKGGLSFYASQYDGAHAMDSTVVLKIGLRNCEKVLECAFKVRARSLDRHGQFRYGLEVVGNTQDLQTISMLEDYIRLLRIAEFKKAA